MRKKEGASDVVQALERLGLGENEAILYSLMLRYTRSTVPELQARSPFPRTMLYYVLNHLVQKGLVTALTEEWPNVYVTENPERLYDILAERERAFVASSDQVRELIPELKNKYRLATGRPTIRLLEGLASYEKALDDVIVSKPDIVYAYDDLGSAKSGLEMRESFEAKRLHKKIKKRTLLFESPAARQALADIPYNDYTEYRFITAKLESFAVDLMVYAGKILHVTYTDREPIAVVTEDAALFTMQKNIFESLWTGGQDATLLSYKK